jgi:hypothetical protein
VEKRGRVVRPWPLAELAAHQAGGTVRRSKLYKYTSPGERLVAVLGRAVQLDTIKTRVDSAPGFSA